MNAEIPRERIRRLNDGTSAGGEYVLYWMQASPRMEENPALAYAIRLANRCHVPVVAGFSLNGSYPDANLRNLRFLLDGLSDVRRSLEGLGIGLVLRRESGGQGIGALARDAAAVVVDRGYLRFQREWYRAVAGSCRCPVIQVEGNVVVPVETASGKEEYSAAALRRKLAGLVPAFLRPAGMEEPMKSSLRIGLPSLAEEDAEILPGAGRSPEPVPGVTGGESAARRRFAAFLERGLDRYAADRNDPGPDACSGMSPYLHFGQVSPVTLARGAREQGGAGAEAFLEELIVRRELAVNFVRYNPAYDSFDCLPRWAQETLRKHAADRRPYLYSREELEQARTHDPYWNAAQREMVRTGRMHGYMRMYWGKKILEWSPSPEEAFATTLFLNNRYELDGRDPNGYAGVAWCFGKHDRPWQERPVVGMVRSMTAAGLERKFEMGRYLSRVGSAPP